MLALDTCGSFWFDGFEVAAKTVIPRSGTHKTRRRRCSKEVAITPKRKSACLSRFIGSGGERNEVEASENQTIYQRTSETKRGEAQRLS
jgi:hypothetical protein